MVLDMLRKLRRPKAGLAPRTGDGERPAAPPGTRVYAIGDVHGRADLLARLHGMIEADAQDHAGRKVAIYLGDYVDRGADSKGVVDLLIDSSLYGFEAVHLLGNHEAWLIQFLDDLTVGAAWMFNGGTATMTSYGVERPVGGDPRTRLATVQAQLRERLPAAHRAFYESLVLNHTEGDYWFVHAGAAPGVPLAAQAADDMLWIRETFLDSEEDFGRVVVHGHTVTAEPEFRHNRIGIDTGAFTTGRLTCLVLEADKQRLLFT